MASNGCSTSASVSPIRPHALILPYPLQGHITPFMQLSKLLAARGFRISFVSSESNIRKLLNAKQGVMASHLTHLGIDLLGIPDGLPDAHHRECTIDPVAFLASLDFLHTSFDELVGKMVQEGVHTSCIISDSFLLWSQDVADKWGIPRICFWPQSLTTFARSISLPKIMEAAPNLDPFTEEVYKREVVPIVLDCIPGLTNIHMSRLPFLTLGGEPTLEWMRFQISTQMSRMNAPLCIICNSWPDLEREVHMHLKEFLPSPPFLTLGPLLSPAVLLGGQDGAEELGTGSSLFDEDEECMQWLDMQGPRSVLYISLGSVALLKDEDVHEITMGLEACQVPFLWVLRSLTSELDFAIQKTQGKVIRWAPQLRALSHQAVGGFMTHCGWNSVLESVCMGVPVIGWPQMMDQVTNCWFQVEKLKVGLKLEVDTSNKVGQASVQKAVQILMREKEGHEMRMWASKVSTLAKSAFTTSLSSNLDSLVQLILSSHTRLPSSQS